MKLNPLRHVLYRLRLAERYLKDAEASLRRKDYRAAVASSQLSAENSAKAVIAFFRIPSWSHDPSPELRELLKEFPIKVRNSAEKLADIVEALAPEHGRATYGEPLMGLTPWDIYKEEDANTALKRAEKALRYSRTILEELGALSN